MQETITELILYTYPSEFRSVVIPHGLCAIITYAVTPRHRRREMADQGWKGLLQHLLSEHAVSLIYQDNTTQWAAYDKAVHHLTDITLVS